MRCGEAPVVQFHADPAAWAGVDAKYQGHVKRNQRSAHSAATPPQAASTATPNQSTDSVIARDSASVNAPEGVKRATHCTPCGTIPPSNVSAPSPAKTNHSRLAK